MCLKLGNKCHCLTLLSILGFLQTLISLPIIVLSFLVFFQSSLGAALSPFWCGFLVSECSESQSGNLSNFFFLVCSVWLFTVCFTDTSRYINRVVVLAWKSFLVSLTSDVKTMATKMPRKGSVPSTLDHGYCVGSVKLSLWASYWTIWGTLLRYHDR